MVWDSPVPIFEDEDEEALKSQFVELSAAHPNESAITIANHVFAKLRDPNLRANQAANQWSGNLAIRERIRQAKLNGNKEVKPLTKDELQQKILAVTEDDNIHYLDKKARIEGYMSLARLNGWEIKAADVGDDDKKNRHFPQIVFALAEQRAA